MEETVEKQKRRSIAVLCSHSYRDPLLQGLILQYLLYVQAQQPGLYRFYLISEEQESYALSAEEQEQEQELLAKQGIFWHPVPYRGGGLILLKKLWNVWALFGLLRRLKKQEKLEALVGNMAIAGGYAYMFSKLFSLPLGVFAFEPHSLNMLDFGIWSRGSLKYRLLSWLERKQIEAARVLLAPTRHTRELFRSWGREEEIEVLGTCIDCQLFVPDAQAKAKLRKQWQLDSEEQVLLYVGKYGGIYYTAEQVARFFARLREHYPQWVFVSISPDMGPDIEKAFADALPKAAYRLLGRLPYEQIPRYFAAADWGLIAVPPLPSQKYRSPVKTGNYLACGLPYIIPRGVSDDDILGQEHAVAWLIDSLEGELDFEQLDALCRQEPSALAKRCRELALRLRSVEAAGQALHGFCQRLLAEE